jgi:hypothetical protein
MGRWCSQTLLGASNQLITIITAYRVCQTARSGLLTAYKQQQRHLITQTNALHPNPRQSMLQDLQSYIQSLLGQTHHILLIRDANSTLQDPDIQAFMSSCHLQNLQSCCESAIPIYTSAQGRHIDFLFGTSLLLSSLHKSGILNFNDSPLSDHRALFADFDEQALFQGTTTDPTAPSQQLLRLNNPSQCKTYLKLVHTYFSAHKVTERSNHLDSLSQGDTPASTISSLYDSLDRDITKGLLHAELQSARVPYGSPWSTTLMKKGQELIFWKHCCSDFCRYGGSLASIYDIAMLSSRPDYASLCQNRHTLSYSLHCLHAACFSLDKCHLQAYHLRQEHLMDCARLAASTSNTSSEVALNNILKAEAASATFRKLKCHAKGEHCTTLKRVEIPILDTNSQPTGASTSITNPSELISAITTQNILYFSQAIDTSGVSGHLGQIISPFTKNVHSDSILQGTYDLSNIDPMLEIRQFLEAMVRPSVLHSTSPVNTTITTLDFQKGFRKLSDKTSSSPSGCHITHYKILATDPDLSQILARAITMPFTHSFSPMRWHTAVQFMLKKNQATPHFQT